MPLARAPMLFVTVAQEKRDFKIFVILITGFESLTAHKKNAAMLFFKITRLRFFISRTIHGSTDCVSTPGVFCIAGCRSLKSCSAGRDLLQRQPLQHRCQDST